MGLRANETRFGGSYLVVDDNYVQILGLNLYDATGAFKGKDVYSSGARLPSNMAPGQTIQINYTISSTRVNPTQAGTFNATEQDTFVGFENLTLAGRTFTNVCKLKSPAVGSTTGESFVSWAANGYGFIRSETQDARGVTVPGTRIELATIVVAP